MGLMQLQKEPHQAVFNATPILEMVGLLTNGWYLVQGGCIASKKLDADGASEGARNFYTGKIAAAKFYAAHILPKVHSLAAAAKSGEFSTVEIGDEAF